MVRKAGNTKKLTLEKWVSPEPCGHAEHHSWSKGDKGTPRHPSVLCLLQSVAVRGLGVLVHQAVHVWAESPWLSELSLGHMVGSWDSQFFHSSSQVKWVGNFLFLFLYPKPRFCYCFYLLLFATRWSSWSGRAQSSHSLPRSSCWVPKYCSSWLSWLNHCQKSSS